MTKDSEMTVVGSVSWSPDYDSSKVSACYIGTPYPWQENNLPYDPLDPYRTKPWIPRDWDKEIDTIIQTAQQQLEDKHVRNFTYKIERDETREYVFNAAGFNQTEINVTVSRMTLYVKCAPLADRSAEAAKFVSEIEYSYSLEDNEVVDEIDLHDGVLTVYTRIVKPKDSNEYKVGYKRKQG